MKPKTKRSRGKFQPMAKHPLVSIKKGQPVFEDPNRLDGVDPLLTPEMCRIALGYKSRRKVLDMIKDGTLPSVDLKEKGDKKNQPRVRRSVLNEFINSLK